MTRETEIAWAAGLFEGEGCISLRSSGAGGAIIIRMTDHDVLERFASIAGFGRIRGPLQVERAHHKPPYEWRATRWSDITSLLAEMRPWLGTRRTEKIDQLLAQPVGLRGREGQTECLRNHPLSGPRSDARVYVKPNGKSVRICRICARIRAAERRAAA